MLIKPVNKTTDNIIYFTTVSSGPRIWSVECIFSPEQHCEPASHSVSATFT